MTAVTATTKMAAVVASGSMMILFTNATVSTLIPGLIGILLMVVGIASEYRPAAIFGLLITLTASALASHTTTLTEVDGILVAAVSVYIPSLFMTWAALSSEPGEPYVLRVRTEPFFRLLVIASVCILSIPAFAVILGVALPTASIGMSTMAEMSVLLLAVIAAAFLLARSSPSGPSKEGEKPAQEE